MNDLALAIETISGHASKAAQTVLDADDAVQAALVAGDEKATLEAVAAYISAEEAWDELRMECARGGIALEGQEERLKARRDEVIEVSADSPARGVFAAAAATIDSPFQAYIEALDKEQTLISDEDDSYDLDPEAIEEDISETKGVYLAALKEHSLSDYQWQAIYSFRSRLTD